jgi:transposase-like protein
MHSCPNCGSEKLVRNGHDCKGAQKYHCKACGQYGTLSAQRGYSTEVQASVKRAVIEWVNLRGIERIWGISR